MTKSSVTCLRCNIVFLKNNKDIKKSKNHFCSKTCSIAHLNTEGVKRELEGSCKYCGLHIRSTRSYCDTCLPMWRESRKTAEKKVKKERIKLIKSCAICGQICKGSKCWDCHVNNIQDYALYEVSYDKHHKSSAFSLVRVRARTLGKRLGWTCCMKCGYSKHIEIAHIKPIGSYPPETMISEINNVSNLVPLCRNCHWEFDHGEWAL